MLWRSMGYADVGCESVAFTDEDVVALHRVLNLIDVGGSTLTPPPTSCGPRPDHSTPGRLADQHLAGLMERTGMIDPPTGWRAAPWRSSPTSSEDSCRTSRPCWSTCGGARSPPPSPGLRPWAGHRRMAPNRVRLLTVGFADMVGYTRLSRRLPEDELASWCSGSKRSVPTSWPRPMADWSRPSGDEVLFVATGAEQAADIAVRLHATHAEDDSVPEMRIGLATGQVLSRMGDVFGTTVTLAAGPPRWPSRARRWWTPRPRGSSEDDPRYPLRCQRGRPVRGSVWYGRSC